MMKSMVPDVIQAWPHSRQLNVSSMTFTTVLSRIHLVFECYLDLVTTALAVAHDDGDKRINNVNVQ